MWYFAYGELLDMISEKQSFVFAEKNWKVWLWGVEFDP